MNEFEALVSTYLDETLDEAQKQRLVEILESNPELRRRFAQLVRNDRALALQLAAESDGQFASTVERALDGALSSRSPAWTAPRTLRFPTRRLALAAAALLIAAFGIFSIVRHSGKQPQFAMGRLSRSIGTVTIADQQTPEGIITTVSTLSNSLCRLDQPDGTVIAVNQDSRLDWLQESTSGSKTLNLSTGQTYLDIAKQKKPFYLTLGSDVRAEVLGTRLLINKGALDKPFYNVLKGRIRIQHGNSVAYVSAGQTVTPWTASDGRPMQSLAVIRGVARPDVMAWLGSLGIDPAAILTEAENLQPAFPSTPVLDYNTYTIMRGHWDMIQDDRGIVLVQKDTQDLGRLVFNPARWLKGDFSCKFKLLTKPAAGTGLQALLCYNNLAMESFGATSEYMARYPLGTVFNLQMRFEVDPRIDTLTIPTITVWPDVAPDERFEEAQPWVKTPANSTVKQRGPCAIGLFTGGCAAEVWDLKLANAVGPDGRPGVAAGASKDVPAGTILFQDDFENGTNKCELWYGRADIIKGEGVDKSRGLRLAWDPKTRAAIMPRFISPYRDYELSFMIRIPGGGSYAYGTHVAGHDRQPPKDQRDAELFAQKTHRPSPVNVWLRHTTVVHGQHMQETLWHGNNKIFEYEKYVAAPFASVGIFASQAPGNTIYLDNIVFRKLDAVPAGTILFQDDFENGTNNWLLCQGGMAIVKGEGMNQSHALQLLLEDDIRSAVLCNYVSGYRSYEVTFMMRLPGPGSFDLGTHVAPATSFAGKEVPATILHQKKFKEVPGSWLRYVVVVRDQIKEETIWDNNDKVLEMTSRLPEPFARIGLFMKQAGARNLLYVDNVVIRKLDDGPDTAPEVALESRISDYYKRHNQFVLQRENSTVGSIISAIPANRMRLLTQTGTARVGLVDCQSKDGRKGQALSIENPTTQPYEAEIQLPDALPDAFAIELDMLPVRLIPDKGRDPRNIPFGYESRADNVPASVQNAVRSALPVPLRAWLANMREGSSNYPLGNWSRYDVKYLKMGRIPATGETIYELRLPGPVEAAMRMKVKHNNTLLLSFTGAEVMLGEVRVRKLVFDNPELNLTDPPQH